MSLTREEKLAEDLDPETRENIEAQYDRIERVESLEEGDRVEIETTNGVSFAGTVVENREYEWTPNRYVVVDVEDFDGADSQEDDRGIIAVDYEGAEGALYDWQGVPYTTCVPEDAGKVTWGDIESMEVDDDA